MQNYKIDLEMHKSATFYSNLRFYITFILLLGGAAAVYVFMKTLRKKNELQAKLLLQQQAAIQVEKENAAQERAHLERLLVLMRENLQEKSRAMQQLEANNHSTERAIENKSVERTEETNRRVGNGRFLTETILYDDLDDDLDEDLQNGLDDDEPLDTEWRITLLNTPLMTDKQWEEFVNILNKVHPSFSKHLNQLYPNLTAAETRLIALAKLDFTPREIADILGISPDSVKKARHRLRKKLTMDEKIDFYAFVKAIQ